MKVYFNEKGRIRRFIPVEDTTQGDHNASKVEAFADFDLSQYFATIALKRPDGVILGPFQMTPVLEDGTGTILNHEYLLTSDDTACAGALEMTVKYDIYQYDAELNETIPVYTKATGMIVAQIDRAVVGQDNTIVNIQYRLLALEKDVAEMQLAYDEITVSDQAPVGKASGHVWFKII